MNCPVCKTETLRITHTFSTSTAKTQTSKCTECSRRFTVYAAILCKAEDLGANKLAKKMQKGDLTVSLEVHGPF